MSTLKKLLTLALLVLTGTVVIFNGFDFPEEVVHFTGPDGRMYRMSLRPQDLTSDESFAIISEIGVSLSTDKRTCTDNAKGSAILSRQIETELELKGVIDELNMRSKPRHLTEAQENTLKKVPICEPYLDELKIISRLLNGYDLIQK